MVPEEPSDTGGPSRPPQSEESPASSLTEAEQEENQRRANQLFSDLSDRFSLSKESYSYFTCGFDGDPGGPVVLEIGVIDEAAVDAYLAAWTGAKWDILRKIPGRASQARQEEFAEEAEKLDLGPDISFHVTARDGPSFAETGRIFVLATVAGTGPLEEIPREIKDLAMEMGVPEDMLSFSAAPTPAGPLEAQARDHPIKKRKTRKMKGAIPMKRCFALVLSLIFILSLAACGEKDQAPASKPKNSSSPVSGSAPASSPEPSSVEPEPEDPSAPENDPDDPPLRFRLGPDGEVKALRAGDTLGGWTLQSYDARWDDGPDGLPYLYDADFTAPEDAPVELNCTVYLSPFASEERIYFFDVAQGDEDKLPALDGTDRSFWFGSRDCPTLSALAGLGPDDRWNCRVALSRYNYSYLPMAAYDIVDVVRLVLE